MIFDSAGSRSAYANVGDSECFIVVVDVRLVMQYAAPHIFQGSSALKNVQIHSAFFSLMIS